MSDRRGVEELKDLGSGKPAPADVERLYVQAFDEFGAQALWSRRPGEKPTIAQALTIADALRTEGDLQARALAARIEAACRAAL